MDKQVVLRKTGRLLFGTPFLIMGLILLGGILALLNHRSENIAYTLGIIACFVVGFVTPHYALGRSASLLGSSWVFFGLVPVLFVPIGPLVSWLWLIDKRMKLKKSLENLPMNTSS